jgi:hypothetical protein
VPNGSLPHFRAGTRLLPLDDEPLLSKKRICGVSAARGCLVNIIEHAQVNTRAISIDSALKSALRGQTHAFG